MKIGITVPEHRLKTAEEIEAERLRIGQEHWDKMTAGDTSDIDAQARLQNEEKKSVVDIQISDSTIIKLKGEDMEKLKKLLQKKALEWFLKAKGGVENWVISFIVGQILAPGKIKKYTLALWNWFVSMLFKFLDFLAAEAKKTESTDIDDKFVAELRNAVEEIIGKEEEK